jgi:hypothetical protein
MRGVHHLAIRDELLGGTGRTQTPGEEEKLIRVDQRVLAGR